MLGRRRRLTAAQALKLTVSSLLASCGGPAAPAAPPPPPPPPAVLTAPAPTSPFALTSLTDDGHSFPKSQLVAALLPRVLDGPIADRRAIDAWEPWTEKPELPDIDAFPDDAALLFGLDVHTELRRGALTFTGPDADTAGRVLAAADAALRRAYRVEIRAVRVAPGQPAPTAADVLSADDARVLARFDCLVRDGSLAVTAARDDVAFPADVELENVTAAPHAMQFGIGWALAVSPARVDGGRAVLRLTFHETRLLGERRIAGDDVERDAPLLATITLAGEFPAVNGVATLAFADAGDPETSLAVAWRVT
ncbi:MAG: hypothetical protein K8T90_21680, partial [Planctomycetes bacterium]|nr:hypothetical protein [Planctomycetota bacterium]